MYIIAGLGNPDGKYRNTRHNIGFDVIDAVAEKNDIIVGEKKHKAVIGKGMIAGEKAVLVKPLTYMNLSGESIRSVIDFYKADEKRELIVISDDVSLDPGQIRIRKRGSDGGHNGLKNIILHLGHDEFIRVRMGVGEKPPKMDLADYVLGHFLPEEWELMNESARKAALAIETIIAEGADAAMNRYNAKKKPQEKGGKESDNAAGEKTQAAGNGE
ncbi:MAG: aminoacyl-tRNA hydrolase [Bacteroidales bacterium]|nr:aminoacyl-tRNA hydrolase [Bacteroidales bacterium]MCM1417091.1 aminoacyl-tRNA hydrolase [bacterium]MCM1424774.1 aminoacyl-tRNA hydrolase [bacterium]